MWDLFFCKSIEASSVLGNLTDVSLSTWELAIIAVTSPQVNRWVLVLPFTHYSFPFPGMNNAVPSDRNWAGWIHRNVCLNRLLVGRWSKLQLWGALAPTPVEVALCLPEPWKLQRWRVHSPTRQHVPVLHQLLGELFSWCPTWNIQPMSRGHCPVLYHLTLRRIIFPSL